MSDTPMTDAPAMETAPASLGAASASTPAAPAAPAAPAPVPAAATPPVENNSTATPGEVKQEFVNSSTASLPNPAENYGAPTRTWLNREVTPALLDGMRWLAKEKPEDPVKALGEFLVNYKKD